MLLFFFIAGDYTVPAGASIALMPQGLHWNPRLYPEPHKFDPDRFLPERSAARHQYAYVPFSAGPRNCIGQKFAMMQLKVMTSILLRKFVFEVSPFAEKPKPTFHVVLKPVDKLNLIIKPRVSL